jgi:two-component system NtrC family sensor kinase
METQKKIGPARMVLGAGAAIVRGLSLRQKGLLTVFVMLLYCFGMTLVITMERGYLYESVEKLDSIHQREEHQVVLNMALARAILVVNENYFSADIDGASRVLVIEIEAVLAGLMRLQPFYPTVVSDVVALQENIRQLLAVPTRSTIADVRANFHRLHINLDLITRDIANQKQHSLNSYRNTFTRLTYQWFGFGILGMAMLGGLMMSFFRRLALDIEHVRARAGEIVSGYRGDPLAITRHDEMGALMEAVNEMQRDLREREIRLELGRQEQFHKEKMAAVGSLAAAVAHEINNPLAAIVGIAEAIELESQVHQCYLHPFPCQAALILEQARRVITITRQVGDFSVPQSQTPALLDLNGLLRSTCSFVTFDRRFKRVELSMDLDPELPAVYGVADHLTQVAMNLLINAGDALEERYDPLPKIRVSTKVRGDSALLELEDNGCGIAPEVLDQVFDEYFTTKAPGRGTGLGLAVCRNLVSAEGGDITIASVLGVGTTVTVILPLTGTKQ